MISNTHASLKTENSMQATVYNSIKNNQLSKDL